MSQRMDQCINIKTECVGVVEDDNERIYETKRKTRNLSEKKRRDQFNTLICELNDLVAPTTRKMDKSTVLKTAINKLKSYNENVARSKEFEVDEDWKPSFMTNEEYSFLMLQQSLGGFIFVFSSCGKILYTCNYLAFALGYLLGEVLNTNIYDIVSEDDRSYLENIFFISTVSNQYMENKEVPLRLNCQFIKKSMKNDDTLYEPVELIGRIKTQEPNQDESQHSNKPLIFVGLIRLVRPVLYTEILLQDHLKTEFVSHHNFEWKFLFLDERARSIIGYSSFELLGTSGYDYYHIDDLDNVLAHHRSLMLQEEGVSGYYRFMTKGHQWVWLQTTSYVNRRQWNSRVEFVVCTHRVVNPLKNDPITEEKQRSCITSWSSSSTDTRSTTDSRASNRTSPPSWQSTTSESNHYEDDASLPRSCEAYFPDDTSLSSSGASSRDLYLHKKRKTLRKCHRYQHRPTSMNYSNNSSDSSSTYGFQYANHFTDTPSENLLLSGHPYEIISRIEDGETTNSVLEVCLQKKCTELQQIIADRTEELRVVSQQLHTARNANQQKNVSCIHQSESDSSKV